jgi:hypothetical protein
LAGSLLDDKTQVHPRGASRRHRGSRVCGGEHTSLPHEKVRFNPAGNGRHRRVLRGADLGLPHANGEFAGARHSCILEVLSHLVALWRSSPIRRRRWVHGTCVGSPTEIFSGLSSTFWRFAGCQCWTDVHYCVRERTDANSIGRPCFMVLAFMASRARNDYGALARRWDWRGIERCSLRTVRRN